MVKSFWASEPIGSMSFDKGYLKMTSPEREGGRLLKFAYFGDKE